MEDLVFLSLHAASPFFSMRDLAPNREKPILKILAMVGVSYLSWILASYLRRIFWVSINCKDVEGELALLTWRGTYEAWACPESTMSPRWSTRLHSTIVCIFAIYHGRSCLSLHTYCMYLRVALHGNQLVAITSKLLPVSGLPHAATCLPSCTNITWIEPCPAWPRLYTTYRH